MGGGCSKVWRNNCIVLCGGVIDTQRCSPSRLPGWLAWRGRHGRPIFFAHPRTRGVCIPLLLHCTCGAPTCEVRFLSTFLRVSHTVLYLCHREFGTNICPRETRPDDNAT